jgi:serine/threonine-protein kinase
MLGKVIGRKYRVIEQIGEGGMGAVFKGLDIMLEREVAIKSLRADLTHDPKLVERFQVEAMALARLNHPNIITLYNFFQDDQQYFMVLELVQGETLDQLIKRGGALDWQTAIAYIGQVLCGLEHAHALKVIHRDIKPANLILTRAGIIKIMDFGIARILEAARLTRTGSIFGTLEYMSPEQIQGMEIDGRSDVYSVGAVLYEMLTGHLLFQRNSDYELIKSQVESTPLALQTFTPNLPPALEAAVLRALAKTPEQRFQTAASFRAELEAVAQTDLRDWQFRRSHPTLPGTPLSEVATLPAPVVAAPAARPVSGTVAEPAGGSNAGYWMRLKDYRVMRALGGAMILAVGATLWFNLAKEPTPSSVAVPDTHRSVAEPGSASAIWEPLPAVSSPAPLPSAMQPPPVMRRPPVDQEQRPPQLDQEPMPPPMDKAQPTVDKPPAQETAVLPPADPISLPAQRVSPPSDSGSPLLETKPSVSTVVPTPPDSKPAQEEKRAQPKSTPGTSKNRPSKQSRSDAGKKREKSRAASSDSGGGGGGWKITY